MIITAAKYGSQVVEFCAQVADFRVGANLRGQEYGYYAAVVEMAFYTYSVVVVVNERNSIYYFFQP